MHRGRRRFRYVSTYFDTDDLVSYRATAFARRRRFKVRTRSYLDTGGSWLEVKTPGARGSTRKARTPYVVPAGTALAGRAREYVEDQLAGIRPGATGLGELRPVLTATYTRVTLLDASSNSRVTIDGDLRWHSSRGALRSSGLVVLETKSASSSGTPVDRLLWAQGHRPQRLSKYGTGMALLDDRLPAHRWRPVLARYFADARRVPAERACA